MRFVADLGRLEYEIEERDVGTNSFSLEPQSRSARVRGRLHNDGFGCSHPGYDPCPMEIPYRDD
jgi:hypothetical protein